MQKSQLALLTDEERLTVLETMPDALHELDEDAVVDLHRRIRKARNKYTGMYRRGGARKVNTAGGRGKAYGKNQRARDKAEVFEDALARVSDRLAVLARQTAEDLKQERLAAARAAKAGRKPGQDFADPSGGGVPWHGKAPKTNTRTKKRRADTQGQGARRQAKRDARA